MATLPEHINACDERVNACDERHLCDAGKCAEELDCHDDEDVVVAFPSTDSLLTTRLLPPEFICITEDVVVAFPSTDSVLKIRLLPPEFICITP